MKLIAPTELWGFYSMPPIVELDFLMPDGGFLTLKCNREQTLHEIREHLWIEARSVAKALKLQLKPADAYTLQSVAQDAKLGKIKRDFLNYKY